MADGEVKAQDLAQETASTLSGNEQFVMFDSTAGKRADIDDVAKYIAGDKSTLKTTDKTSPVAAINENFDAIADLKEDIDSLGEFGIKSKNEFGNSWTTGGYINPTTGEIVPAPSFKYTDFYQLRGGTHRTLFIKSSTTLTGTIIFYDSSKNILGNISVSVGDSPISDSVAYIRHYASTSFTGNLYISTVEPLGTVDYTYEAGLDLKYNSLPVNLMKECIVSDNKFSGYWITGSYIDASDNIVSAPNWKYTPKYIELPNGKNRTLYVALSSNVEGVFVIRYDKNYTRIQSSSTIALSDSYEIEDNVKYLRCYAKTGFTGNLYLSTQEPSTPVDYSFLTEMLVSASKIEPEEADNKKPLNVVNFGDSIIGNFQETSGNLISISALIAKMTGYNVVNGGFGGCRMSSHEPGWDAFSMYRIADAITTGDWTLQDAAWAIHDSLNLPGYFGTTIATLKAIDFSDVDIITIEYGTNDWASGKVLTPSVSAPLDTDTFGGALSYSIKTILDEYPNMKIIVQNPTPRFIMSGSTIVETSDTATNTRGNTLVELITEENNVCKGYKVPVVDAYYNSLINPSTHDVYMYSATEDVHLGLKGRERVANLVAKYMMYEL